MDNFVFSTLRRLYSNMTFTFRIFAVHYCRCIVIQLMPWLFSPNR